MGNQQCTSNYISTFLTARSISGSTFQFLKFYLFLFYCIAFCCDYMKFETSFTVVWMKLLKGSKVNFIHSVHCHHPNGPKISALRNTQVWGKSLYISQSCNFFFLLEDKDAIAFETFIILSCERISWIISQCHNCHKNWKFFYVSGPSESKFSAFLQDRDYSLLC